MKSKTFNRKGEKPIFMGLRGPKGLDDKGHEGTRRINRKGAQGREREGWQNQAGAITYFGAYNLLL
jgi:hypothetical protein